MNKICIAVVGCGFVGKAVAHGFDNELVDQIHIDPILGTSIEQLKDQDITATFICVPTPMGESGKINASIVTNTIEYLMENVSGLIILKSTVVPSIIKTINEMDGSHRFVYNPEFLTERNANQDFVNPFMHVFGCNSELIAMHIENLYTQFSNCNPCPIKVVEPEEAAFIKYGINSFLATKVAWFNQFYELTQKFDLDYDKISSAIGTDPRITESHTKVPGPDGKRWFGGPCFSKDVTALLNMAQDMDSNLSILQTAINENAIGRSQYEMCDREIAQNINFDFKV
jgi:UDPglucose 6-dehydrogenase